MVWQLHNSALIPANGLFICNAAKQNENYLIIDRHGIGSELIAGYLLCNWRIISVRAELKKKQEAAFFYFFKLSCMSMSMSFISILINIIMFGMLAESFKQNKDKDC